MIYWWWNVNDILYEMRFYSMIIEFMNKRWGNYKYKKDVGYVRNKNSGSKSRRKKFSAC